MERIRVFVSYDVDHDGDLIDLVKRQADGAEFEVACQSRSGAMSEQWSSNLQKQISSADEVVVLCGEHTQDSPRSALELKTAQEKDKPYLLLWGRRNVMCTKPASATKVDAMYSWAPSTLGQQIGDVLSRWKAKQES